MSGASAEAAGLEMAWILRLGRREVAVRSRPDGAGGFEVSMDQGRPEFGEPMPSPTAIGSLVR